MNLRHTKNGAIFWATLYVRLGGVIVTSKKTRHQLFLCSFRYVFVCNDWIKVRRDMSKRYAKALKLENVEESHLTAAQSTSPCHIGPIIIRDKIIVCSL